MPIISSGAVSLRTPITVTAALPGLRVADVDRDGSNPPSSK